MKRNWLAPAISILVFFLTGLALIPYPGLQNDELFFSGPLYFADAAVYRWQFGATKIPVMLLSYSGALKTWLYWLLFRVFEPNLWSVRVPMLLAGMATIWLTWIWVRRLAGPRAAALASVFLATDTLFLMTGVFDWGPVALQHLFLMAGLVAFDRWLRIAKTPWLALAALLWGLGLWDKALLIWPLSGLALASICIYPRQTLSRLRPLPLAVAAAAFLIGAAPLVTYNLDMRGQTATANTHFTTEEFDRKLIEVRHAINGTSLFGYMVYPNDPDHRIEPRTSVGRVAENIANLAGDHKYNAMTPAYLAALAAFLALVALAAPQRRFLAFLLLTTLIAWAQMAFTRNTGTAVHHIILLWPFPVVFLAIAFDAIAARIPRFGASALLAATLFFAGENLLTTNEYLKDFAVYGAAAGWTDALYRLAGSVGHKDQASWYGLVDWGYLNGLRLLFEGDLPVFLPDFSNPAELKSQIETPDRLFIQHTDDKQMFPGINQRLRDAAAGLGYEEKTERIIPDRNGRPVFELFRFEKASAPASR